MSIIEANRANLKGITDAQIMAAFKMAGHDHPDADDLVVTGDTIADFKTAARTFWTECHETRNAVYDGWPAIEFRRVQIRRNDPRRAVTVIDFGDVRIDWVRPDVRAILK